MNTSILKTMLLVGLLSIVGSPAWSEEMKGGVEEAVAALERQWLGSIQTNNIDLAAPLIADMSLFTSIDGKVSSKAEYLASEKATRYTSAEETDSKVIVFGDTAIATGVIKTKGMDSSGKPFASTFRYTDTWVKMPNGQWQCVASHGSPVAM